MCTASTSVLRHDPPRESAKEQSGTAAADRTPTPKSVTEPPNTKSNTQELSKSRAMFSLTVYSRTRKRKEDNLNVRTSEVRWESLIYLDTFSLLAVTDLDTWLASSCTRAIIWSLLDLGAASDSHLAKLLMHGTIQCIVVLECDLYWIGELGCLRTHLPCGLAGRLHHLHHLFHHVCSNKLPPDLILWSAGKCLSSFISGDVLSSAIFDHLVAWVYIWRLHLQLGDRRSWCDGDRSTPT